MKGKKLEVGQYVLITKAPKQKRASVMILKVAAVDYPFAVFEYEVDSPLAGFGAVMVGPTGPMIAPGDRSKRTEIAVVDVRRHRFQVLPEEFVQRARGHREPAWLHEGDKDKD